MIGLKQKNLQFENKIKGLKEKITRLEKITDRTIINIRGDIPLVKSSGQLTREVEDLRKMAGTR
jgi:CMP-2-keto-3-deoxyoctulosonic acid synthetase